MLLFPAIHLFCIYIYISLSLDMIDVGNHRALDAACGMMYLSDKSVVHGDLGARNLLVNPRATVS